jgi:DNA-binding response OmpR family regulator
MLTNNLWPDELKILVVDDEQDILNLIRLSLEPAGFRVLRTTRSAEGLELALREIPDLLVLDIVMPGLNGLELLRRVRRHPKLKEVPAIILSANASTVNQRRMLKMAQEAEDHVDAYLGKPFNPSELLCIVKQVLVNHKDFLLEKQAGENQRWKEKPPLELVS